MIQLHEPMLFFIYGLLGLQLNTAIMLAIGSKARDSEHASQITTPYNYLNGILGMSTMFMLSRP
ncbi:hypothetical protein OE165_28215, partial [Escherichia coli]|uniref:hypothetical protein n=1 Tax=Escherichia coli TaxID=562 RepID=UPI0021F30713